MLYAMSAYGHEGVVRALQILKDEMEMNMRLIGAPTIADLVPSMVDTKSMYSRSMDPLVDSLFRESYEPLRNVQTKAKL